MGDVGADLCQYNAYLRARLQERRHLPELGAPWAALANCGGEAEYHPSIHSFAHLLLCFMAVIKRTVVAISDSAAYLYRVFNIFQFSLFFVERTACQAEFGSLVRCSSVRALYSS